MLSAALYERFSSRGEDDFADKLLSAMRFSSAATRKRPASGALMTASRSDALVLFGATGDLAHKKIFPALYALVKHGALNVPIIGVAAPKWSLEQLRSRDGRTASSDQAGSTIRRA